MTSDNVLWPFIDECGTWMSQSYGFPRMTGRVLGWLLVCDPPEQTAAQIAEALDASAGSISGATGMLVRGRLIERIRIRGERADRFRMRPAAWEDQMREAAEVQAMRQIIARGLEALSDAPLSQRARLEETDEFYAWWESRMPRLWEEWQDYKRTRRSTT